MLAWIEKQTASFKIWTLVTNSILCGDNRRAKQYFPGEV